MSIEQKLHSIRRMPYGTARTAAAEAISRRVEADGPKEKLAEALLDLVEAYTFAGKGAQSFVVFARTLRLWDESPELFDDSDEHNMFWEFKWVASDLPDYAQITKAQAEAFLDDMERRFALQGIGLSAVQAARFGWTWQSGLPDAERARLAWIATPRDGFDDCRACTIGQQTDFFLEQGRPAEALELGLSQDAKCNLEPTKTHFATALAALNVGDAEQALRSHKLALATIGPGNRDLAQSRGQSFELLARGGHVERALRELRGDYRSMLTDPPSPLLHLRFLLGVLAGLSAHLDRGELGTVMALPGESGGEATLSELHAWVAERVRGYAEAFDARSGTTYYAGLAARALAAKLAPVLLDYGSDSDRGSGAPGGTAPTRIAEEEKTVAEQLEPPSVSDPDVVLARAESALAHKAFGDAAREYSRAVPMLEAAGWIERAGLAAAEGAQCAALDADEERAHSLFGRALPLLRSGGADHGTIASVLAAWAPVAARMNDAAAQIRATAGLLASHGEFSAEGLTDELAERRRAEWLGQRATLRDTLARSIAAAEGMRVCSDSSGSAADVESSAQGLGRLDRERAVAEALLAGEEFAQLGIVADAAHAFWLAGRVQLELGDTTAAVWSLESAFEGFTVARKSGERLAVAGELIDLLRATGQSERADALVAEL